MADQSLQTLKKPAARIGNIDEQNAIINSIAGTMADLRRLRSYVTDKDPYVDFTHLLKDFKSALHHKFCPTFETTFLRVLKSPFNRGFSMPESVICESLYIAGSQITFYEKSRGLKNDYDG